MAVHTLPAIAAARLGQGRAATTPVLVVQDGGLPSERVHRSALSEVADMMVREQVTAPAVVVVGDVAGIVASG
jgi:siroheme synthase